MSARIGGALALLFAALAVAGIAGAGDARAASPQYEIHSFGATSSSAEAGGHPDITVSFEVTTPETLRIAGEDPDPCLCDAVREVVAQLPAGVIGNPHATPRCTVAEFAANACPVDSQVGVVVIRLNAPAAEAATEFWVTALFNMVPKPGQAGLLALPTPQFGPKPIFIEITARTEGDYGLETRTVGIPRLIAVNATTVVNWGVPALPEHDALRFPFGGFEEQVLAFAPQAATGCGDFDPTPAVLAGEAPRAGLPQAGEGCFNELPGVASNSAPVPFLSGPTTCGEPLLATLDVLSYNTATDHAEAPYPTTTGCAALSFDPSQSVQPTTSEADSPAGLDFTLDVPQFQSPTTPSPSSIRSTVVEFPPGLSVNTNSASGKTSCTDEQAGFGTRNPARCPENAKIGTLSIDSSALPGLLHGSVYLGEPLPGNRYRIFLIAEGFGLNIKLDGTAHPDAKDGMSVRFVDLPQAPFQQFRMHIFGGERGVLATPTRCGTYAVKSTFTPWADELGDQTSTQFFTIDEGPDGKPCPGNSRPFAPGFQAGVTDSTAGAHSPFVVEIARGDGEQFLRSVDVSTPEGFSGILRGIPYCPESAIATVSDPLYSGLAELGDSACPSASQIGTATGGAGAGSQPLYTDGKAYLAGPYKGAPLSLIVVIPAVSGPYDLGNIATRVAIHVNPTTGRVSTISDPLPQQIDGIPLRVRFIRVNVDRDRFALNPTNCKPLSTDATLRGAEGASVDRSAHFQVANCGALDFAPRLGIRLLGSGRRSAHPALQAVLRANEGDANIARSVVALPRTTLLDQGNLVNICTREQFANDSCPPGSIYGRAAAFSPLLDQPLRGFVYLRSNGGARTLPDLVMDLKGQVDFELVAFVDSVRGGLRTIIPTVPDVPVDRFVLRMQGGARKGLVVNSTNLCRNPARFRAVMVGQNGKRFVTRPKLRARCGKKRRAKRSKRRAAISLAREAG